MPAALLLLADSRLPTGGHAHSWGVEEAASRGRVHDVASLRAFALGRLRTAGLTDAALSAAAAFAADTEADWRGLDAEAEARTASPALRAVSRRSGRQLVRAGRAIWPHPTIDAVAGAHADGPHQAVAFGVVAHAAGVSAADAALASAHLAVAAVCTAAVRLLGLDPYAVHATAAAFAPAIEDVAAEALAAAVGPWPDLPCPAPVAAELGAERHATWEVKLFAS